MDTQKKEVLFDTIIFDLDGTLLDTLTDLTNSINFMLKQEGYPTRTEQQVRSYLGYGAAMLVESALPEGISSSEAKHCLTEYQKIYAENREGHTQPYPGIIELLKKLKSKNISMAVVSNKPHLHTVPLVEKEFDGYIDLAIGDRKGIPRKPNRRPIDDVIEKLSANRESTLYVGDSEVDIQTAKNAEVRSVAVTWGFRDQDVLSDESPDYMIDQPTELLTIIENG